MTKNGGSGKADFFVKKEEFRAKNGRKAESTMGKRNGILHKTAHSVHEFNFFWLRFSVQTLIDGRKKRSVFFTRLSHFSKRHCLFFAAMSQKTQKTSHLPEKHRFSKLSEYSKIFDQKFFLSEFSNLSEVVVKIFRNRRSI